VRHPTDIVIPSVARDLFLRFDVVTIFPDFFRGPLDYGIVRKAREAGLVEINVHDLREFTHDRHRTVDDRPFGGGEGMVLKPEPIFECMQALGVPTRAERGGEVPTLASRTWGTNVVLTSASGQLFDQRVATEMSSLERIVLICGRYEGVDERIAECIADREVSVGDYVLSGGELPAAIIVDAITRLIPGALGNEASAFTESFSPRSWTATEGLPDSTAASGGLLDYPHYTRPASFNGAEVPEVLLGGNHDEIRRWRRYKALEKTFRNRPDLLPKVVLNDEDRRLLSRIAAESESRDKESPR
jgi:tRNA (guanine37-N1)-methyltransferase